MLFGAHVRQSGGLGKAIERGESAGCDVIQVFTQSPRQWRPTSRDVDELAALAARRRSSSCLRDWVCHATYLINLGSTDEAVRARSAACLTENLRVASALGAASLIVHVGSHLGAGLEPRLPPIADAIGAALEVVPAGSDLLLENTAGAGGTIGRTFEELALVIDAAGGSERLGVCLDSQHLWAAGIDFSTPAQMDAVIDGLDAAVGLSRLRCLHLNDSKVPLGAHRDRHANLGEGWIGEDGLASFLGHPAVQRLPAV
ncbi:MAG: deoxyribonuclease, partial [Acidimicrobiaceae bacterium]|nr:deoxyribonuclease [Acidimicrobiaceae bacterium]